MTISFSTLRSRRGAVVGALAVAVAAGSMSLASPAVADDAVPDSLPRFIVADAPTSDEIAGLLWMREEEKLAHDVYVAMYDLWQLPVFDKIAQSETAHMEAVLRLLNRYGIPDPASAEPGVFSDPVLQQLYDDLVAEGSVSATAALYVGATIEELDIVDLRERATDNADIARVYANLERGSENHLRAFVRKLDRRGETFVPTLLSQSEYDEIIGAAAGRRRGRG